MADMFKVTLPSALDAGVDFPKLTEIRFNIKTLIPTQLVRLNIEFSAVTVIKLSGAVKFYDSTGTTDLGQTLNTTAGANIFYFKPVGEFYIGIENKFTIVRFGNNYLFSQPTEPATPSVAVACTLDVKNFKYLQSLLTLRSSNVLVGDINNIPKTVTQLIAPVPASGTPYLLNGLLKSSTLNYAILGDLDLSRQTKIVSESLQLSFPAIRNLTLNETDFNLEITQLGPLAATLNLTNCNVVMDISILENISTISSFNASGSKLYGDVKGFSKSSISALGNLKGLRISGDIANINNATIFLSNINSGKNQNAHLSTTFWSTKKPDRSYILATEGVRIVSGVDQFLIDMASLNLSPTAVSGDAWLRTIAIRGTRTTASDAAVATLAGKGITVTLTNPS